MTSSSSLKQRFYHSLKRGTGEAYILAKNNPSIDFSRYIIRGALKNFAYDGQSEDSRAQYIFDLISISTNKDEIRNAVYEGLASEVNDTWSLTHLFGLAKLFAQNGDERAKKAIYDRFLVNAIEGSDWVGYAEILELDGIDGLLYISEKFGKFIEQVPEDSQDDSIIEHFQRDNPKIQVREKLETAARTNRYIRIYLDNVERTRVRMEMNRPNFKRNGDTVDELLNNKRSISYKQLKELSNSEVHRIAERLLKEKSKSMIESFLRVFQHHPFPFDAKFILNLAKKQTSPGSRISEYAIEALRFLKSNDVRNFALERITKTYRPSEFTNIIITNYQEGDVEMLNDVANKFSSEHIIEHLAMSYSDIYSANNTIECREPLEILYGKMNCGIHRNQIVRILLKNKVLSDNIREEIKYDSYLETRILG